MTSSLNLKPVSLNFSRAFMISGLSISLASHINLSILSVPTTFNFIALALLRAGLSSKSL